MPTIAEYLERYEAHRWDDYPPVPPRVVRFLATHPGSTVAEIGSDILAADECVRSAISHLRKAGVVTVSGHAGRSRRYSLKEA